MGALPMMAWLGFALLPGLAVAAAPVENIEAVEAQLSGPEMVQRAEKVLEELQKGVAGIENAFEEAEGAADTLLTNCLGERLGEMKGLQKAGNEAKKALDKAVADKNDAAATREYQKIAALQKKAGEVRQGASECGGTEGGEPFAVPELEESSVQPQAIPFARQPAASPTL